MDCVGIVAGLRGDASARRRAVDELYKRYGGRLKHYLARGITPARAEDLLHEVFIRVLRRGDTFEAEAQQFEAWLWTIARNVRIDQLRKQDFDPEEMEEEPADPNSNPESTAETDALRRCVARGYQQFRSKFPQRAIALSWLVTDHLSVREIAGILERSEGATREYLSQCRKKLEPFLQVCREFLAA
jgi:RNA polymerase sigma factor (sigma-70 family)